MSLSRESLGGRQFTALFAVTSGGWSSSSSGWVTQVSSRFPDCNQCTKNLRIPAAPVSWVCTTSIRGVVAYWCDRRAGMSSPFWGSGAPGLSWSAWLSWKTLGLFPVRSLKHQSGRGPGMDPSTMGIFCSHQRPSGGGTRLVHPPYTPDGLSFPGSGIRDFRYHCTCVCVFFVLLHCAFHRSGSVGVWGSSNVLIRAEHQ